MAGTICIETKCVEEDMSLLDNAMEKFIIVDKTTVADGYGGTITVWTDGAEIKAACVLNSTGEASIAAALGATSNYVVTTRKNVTLMYHDVIRRVSDGKVFRITSDGTDQKTPASASLNMRNVTAEEWKIPNG